MKNFILGFAIFTGFFLLYGCGSKSPTTISKLTVKGSDTMVILNQRWAEEFMKLHSESHIQVTGGGSGTGIAAVLNGTTDIASSSRSINESEKNAIEKKFNKKLLEIPVALDAITIFVNKDNPINELTLEQLKDIFIGKITNWKEIGGQPSKIIIYSRENNSGTYEFFKDHVLQGEDYAEDASYLIGTASIVNALQNDANGIGYGGIAYLPANVKALKIKIDMNSLAILPSLESVQNETYPLSRKLYYYSVGNLSDLEKRYIQFVLSPKGQEICKEVGYFPLVIKAPGTK